MTTKTTDRADGNEPQCSACGATSVPNGPKMKKCSKCMAVHYCSAVCQKEDW